MTNNIGTAPPTGKKRPARLADAELNHLEAVLGIAGRRFTATSMRGLNTAYWSARVDAIAAQHDLVASQKKRVAVLSSALTTPEPTVRPAAAYGARVARLAA